MEESRSISGIAHLLFRLKVRAHTAVQDYHPRGHISFASSHPGQKAFTSITVKDKQGKDIDQILWPDHCVRRIFLDTHAQCRLGLILWI